MVKRPVHERIIEKTTVSKTNCWIFNGCLNADGYAKIVLNDRPVSAHRMMYQHKFGQIPKGMMVCHKCDNRNCVNPDHLFLGTAKDNRIDCVNKKRVRIFIGLKKKCKRSHLFSIKNTVLNAKGYRLCLKCRKINWQNYAERKKNERTTNDSK